MNVVIFTGGNGNANLIKHLKEIPYVNLSLLINGYDDGLSTGIIRSANQGMLGPSDFRKNFTYIIDDYTESNRNLKRFFEHRLSAEETRDFMLAPAHFLNKLIASQYSLDESSIEFISRYFVLGAARLLEFTHEYEELLGFSLGNIIIGGIFVETRDFNLALLKLTTQFQLTAQLINVSTEDDSKLVAFDSEGNFLRNEADIVNFNGQNPLQSFYLLPLSELLGLDSDKQYNEDAIKSIAQVPPISKEAKGALEHADLIIFGSGTQFSSLLPSYRICQREIQASSAKKVVVVNNQFDSDIRNITFERFIHQILQEFNEKNSQFFDAILLDPSGIIQPDTLQSNIIIQRIADSGNKHDGQKLWNWICRSLDMSDGAVHIAVNFYGNSIGLVDQHYLPEIAKLNNDHSRKIKFVLEDDSEKVAYQLHIDASGKIPLYEIDSWINFVQMNQIDVVIGSRFESRRQLIRSFKYSLVESNRYFIFALATSYFVSFIYFLRFGRVVPDPLSGIYLVKANYRIKYKNISNFLKQVNRIPTVQFASFPIGYRTFKLYNGVTKVWTVFKNLARLYV